MGRKMKRAKGTPTVLTVGQAVTLVDGPYRQSWGHIVVLQPAPHIGVQVHIDAGDGAGHEIVTSRQRLVVLNEQEAQP